MRQKKRRGDALRDHRHVWLMWLPSDSGASCQPSLQKVSLYPLALIEQTWKSHPFSSFFDRTFNKWWISMSFFFFFWGGGVKYTSARRFNVPHINLVWSALRLQQMPPWWWPHVGSVARCLWWGTSEGNVAVQLAIADSVKLTVAGSPSVITHKPCPQIPGRVP